MDPEWQRQAAQAMEERAAGEFDDFKEREFEQYWGQKQKVEWNVLAGHASKVRLEELLREGLFHVGDVWRFDHTWGRGKDAIRVEKDCKIVEIDGKSITLAIPPGQLKFARRLEQTLPAATDEIMTPHEPEVTKSETPNRESSGMGKAPMADDESEVRNQSVSLPKVNGAVESDMSFGKGAKNHTDVEAGEEQATTEGVMESRNGTTKVDPEPHGSLDGPMLQLRRYSSAMSSELSDPPPRSENVTTPTKATANNQSDALSAATEYDIILCTTTGLLDLEKKILSIDGRTKPGSRTGSAWRDIRCLRNEQDMGSLFEMRDEYYAYKIAKGDYRCERFSR